MIPPQRGGPGAGGARVLHVVTNLGVGGAERLVVSAARELPPRFESAICCLTDRGPLADEAAAAGIPVFCVGQFPGLSHPFAFLALQRTIRRFRPAIVHTHLQSANLYGRLAAILAGVPVVAATEHNVYEHKRRRYVIAERWLARRTDALIAVSPRVRTFLARQLALEDSDIRVVPNGVRVPQPSLQAGARFRTATECATGAALRIGTVASLTAKKGHEYLLEAIALLRDRGVRCALFLAGDGPERARLEALVGERRLRPCVQFLGNVAPVADLLDAIDLFVLPSRVEGLPLALLEAMLAGKPVVATAVGGVPDVIDSGATGVLVAPRDAGALADAIERLAASPELRARLASAACQQAQQHHSEAAYVSALAALYDELLAGSAQ